MPGDAVRVSGGAHAQLETSPFARHGRDAGHSEDFRTPANDDGKSARLPRRSPDRGGKRSISVRHGLLNRTLFKLPFLNSRIVVSLEALEVLAALVLRDLVTRERSRRAARR